MSSLTEALNGILQWLDEHDPAAAQSLRAPATDEELDTAAAALGRELPAEVRQLYRWHDGTHVHVHRFELAPGLYLIPIDEAIREHVAELDFHGTDVDDAAYRLWQRDWLPIAADGCGGHMY